MLSQLTPDTPMPLSPAAAMMPATCVPCPSSSMGSWELVMALNPMLGCRLDFRSGWLQREHAHRRMVRARQVLRTSCNASRHLACHYCQAWAAASLVVDAAVHNAHGDCLVGRRCTRCNVPRRWPADANSAPLLWEVWVVRVAGGHDGQVWIGQVHICGEMRKRRAHSCQ